MKIRKIKPNQPLKLPPTLQPSAIPPSATCLLHRQNLLLSPFLVLPLFPIISIFLSSFLFYFISFYVHLTEFNLYCSYGTLVNTIGRQRAGTGVVGIADPHPKLKYMNSERVEVEELSNLRFWNIWPTNTVSCSNSQTFVIAFVERSMLQILPLLVNI